MGAIGASKNLRRFGQSIKRVAREVKEAETPGKNFNTSKTIIVFIRTRIIRYTKKYSFLVDIFFIEYRICSVEEGYIFLYFFVC